MTIAQQIAAALDNDGQQWRTRPTDESDPMTFTDLVERHGAYIQTWRDNSRFTFSDGSVITVAGSAWDLGFPDCYCWAGAGHDDTCNADNALEIFDAITDCAHEPHASVMSHDDLVEAAIAQGEHFYREISTKEAILIAAAILCWRVADNSLDQFYARRDLRRAFDALEATA